MGSKLSKAFGIGDDFFNVSSKNLNPWVLLALIGVLMQTYVMSVGKGPDQMLVNPFIWLIGGVAASLVAVFYSFKGNIKINQSSFNTVWIYDFVFVSMSLLTMAYLTSIFYNNPSDPTQSDVVPTLQIMTQRIMDFQYPYYTVEFPGWSFEPGYLPMQYLPFIKAEILKIDYRTLAYLAFVFVLFFYLSNIKKFLNSLELFWGLSLVIIPFVGIKVISIHDASVFKYSVELLDAAYYLLLAYSLFSGSVYLRAVAIVACLLSRYGIVIWLPAYAFIYYREEGLQKAIKLTSIVVGLVLVLYVLPFMTKDPMLFFKGLKNYDQMAVGQWTDIPSWYAHIGKPYILSQGLGFAIYFLEYWDGEIIDKIKAIKLVHVLLSVLIMVGTILFYHIRRPKIKDVNLYLLGSLALYLTVFYSFVFAPFSYLFLVPYFVSMSILFKIPIYNHEK